MRGDKSVGLKWTNAWSPSFALRATCVHISLAESQDAMFGVDVVGAQHRDFFRLTVVKEAKDQQALRSDFRSLTIGNVASGLPTRAHLAGYALAGLGNDLRPLVCPGNYETLLGAPY